VYNPFLFLRQGVAPRGVGRKPSIGPGEKTGREFPKNQARCPNVIDPADGRRFFPRRGSRSHGRPRLPTPGPLCGGTFRDLDPRPLKGRGRVGGSHGSFRRSRSAGPDNRLGGREGGDSVDHHGCIQYRTGLGSGFQGGRGRRPELLARERSRARFPFKELFRKGASCVVLKIFHTPRRDSDRASVVSVRTAFTFVDTIARCQLLRNTPGPPRSLEAPGRRGGALTCGVAVGPRSGA